MEIPPKRYIVDESNNPISVVIDLATFRRIEEALENYALKELMLADNDDEILSLEEAQAYYEALEKAP